ncbi:MAG: exosome complex protein Rrp42 [Promethearchaeati archaeon SRVP18_Atabeyarchaeia-1]
MGERIVSEIERNYIISIVDKGKRLDSRGFEDYREIKVETDIIKKAEGSALVTLGDTKVLVGVKADIGAPFPDTPDRAVLTVNAEFTAGASPLFEPGPPDEGAIELARVVDRGIRESESVDLKKLCLIPGKKVWVIFVDVYILDHGGNLFDASELGAMSALMVTKIPKAVVEGDEVKLENERQPLPLKTTSVSVTLAKIGSHLLVDPIVEEESVMDCRLTMATDNEGHIVAVQKGGVGTFTPQEILKAAELTQRKATELRGKLPKRED